jgi:nucleoside 2-deoxyribosyltransferase
LARLLRRQGHKVLSAHLYENFGEMDVSGRVQEVCSRDFQWMRQCDLFVAVLPLDRDGNVICSSGTSVELGWASAMGKPIVLVCDPEAKYSHLVIGLDAVARVATVRTLTQSSAAQWRRYSA